MDKLAGDKAELHHPTKQSTESNKQAREQYVVETVSYI